MMIMTYDKSGVIKTDIVPPGVHCNSGKLQNVSARCFASKNTPKSPATGVLIFHDDARPHASGAVSEILDKYGWQVLSHPPYGPDMSPSDFDLFQKLKKPFRGKRFRSTEEVSNEVTRVIRRINNEGVLTGIKDLPKRWTAAIKHNGDYIEGL
jgi:histone-lysine N-methyltransferase SETMAR